jgi:hypothetical protein
MTIRRLNVLQWAGLFGGGAAWFTAHVLGYGATLAECNAGSAHWGLSNDAVEGTLLGVAAVLAVVAELAALAVLAGTRNATYESDPPRGRIRFFAIAAAVANVIFLTIVLLDLAGTLSNAVCRQG